MKTETHYHLHEFVCFAQGQESGADQMQGSGCRWHPLVSSLMPALFRLRFASRAVSAHWNTAFVCFTALSAFS